MIRDKFWPWNKFNRLSTNIKYLEYRVELLEKRLETRTKGWYIALSALANVRDKIQPGHSFEIWAKQIAKEALERIS